MNAWRTNWSKQSQHHFGNNKCRPKPVPAASVADIVFHTHGIII